ncbi:MAG TPA: hypothetical protein VJC08_00530, partial [bacterium]|nr:hypothetical protein [bacterium]
MEKNAFLSWNKLIIILILLGGVMSTGAVLFCAEPELKPISARDAVKIAREQTQLGSEYITWYEYRVDALMKAYYVIDFVKCDKNETFCYFIKRVLVNPKTGEIEANRDSLKEWQASAGQVPDTFDPVTKIERKQPLREHLITVRQAIVNATVEAGLGPAYEPRVQLKRDIYDTIRYVVDFVKCTNDETCYWQSRVVVDPYNGQIERDPDILSTFNAQKGVRPKDLIFVGNSNQIISPVMKRVLTFTLFCLCSLFILGVVAFFKRKKLGRWTAIDWILCWLSAILFYITGVIAAFAPSRVDIALLALSSCVMVFVLWLVHRDLRNMMGVDNNKGIPQVSAKSLPNFSMVGGMEDVKKEISNTVGILLRQPGYAAHFNLNFNGVLFYGPAGVGKSL